MPRNVRLLLPLVGLAFLASGCLMAGTYHSARTLGKGESSLGTNFSFTTYEYRYTDSDGVRRTGRFSLPNLIPELTYHIGITDDVEAGGRIALGSLGVEGDVKWRFHRSEKLHLAIAPALGYQPIGLVRGTTLRIPGILTYDLADNFSVNAAIFWATSHFEPIVETEGLGVFDGTLGAAGAAFGVELRGEVLAIRPMLEFTRYVARFGGDSFDGFSTVNLMIHIARIGGREKKQLDRIEQKIDRMGGDGGGEGGYEGDGY
jgi:hypothetical protein